MKVCFISVYAYSLFNPKCSAPFGGSEVQLYQIANKLAEDKNNQISFLVGDFGQKSTEVYHSIRVIKTLKPTKSSIKYLTGIYHQIKFIIQLKRTAADTFIQRAAGLETGTIAFFCKLFKKKFIYMTASSIDINGQYKKMKPLEGFFFELGLKNTAAIVTQNQEHRQALKKNYNLDSTIIKNSYPLPPKIPNLKQKKHILWVGSSQPLKQPQIFLNLAKSIPQQKFIIIMPKHNQHLWAQIKKQAKQIKNLHFIEKVPFTKINQFFKQALLFINTSTYEGFPNTFVQATMYATPIISLNVNPDNFLNHQHCGYFAQGNTKKLFDLTKKTLKNQNNWTKLCQNAYSYSQKNHDINRNIIKLTKIVDSKN